MNKNSSRSPPNSSHNSRNIKLASTQLHRASNSNMSNIHLSSSLLNDSTQASAIRMGTGAATAGLTLGQGLLYQTRTEPSTAQARSKKNRGAKNTSPPSGIQPNQTTQPSITQNAQTQNSVLQSYAPMSGNRPGGHHLFSNPNINVGLRRSLHVHSDEASASSYERTQLFTAHSSNVNNTADSSGFLSFFANQRIPDNLRNVNQ